jgi:uncharacterized delta-60 repeat protein
MQTDGKIIIGGEFTSYNGTTRSRIARLNADGSIDANFNPVTGADNIVLTIAVQSNGKIIIGGKFKSYNGTSRNRIVRLNTDGSLDATFNHGTGTSGMVSTIAVQPDGKIIIGGDFTSYNGTSRNNIARLNADGSLEGPFNSGTGSNTAVSDIAFQADGKIIIGGVFSSYNSTSINFIARINADGSLDASFNPGTGANNSINATALQADGKIIIGGNFTSYNSTPRNRIARLNADGSLDTTFSPSTGANRFFSTFAMQADRKIIIGWQFFDYTDTEIIVRLNADGNLDGTFNPGTGPNGGVSTIAIQADGKIIIGGEFVSYNGTSRSKIARLNADGSLDPTFNPGTGANRDNDRTAVRVDDIAIQADGKIIIGGGFTSYNGTVSNNIARLNPDGSLDATFNPGTGANDYVSTTALQSDGKIIIGGNFTSYNGTSRNKIARLNADGSLDDTFNPGTGVDNVVLTNAVQADGNILIGGHFDSYNGTHRNGIARLNADGSLDPTFNPETGASGTVSTIAVQTDGEILIGGGFTGYNNLSTPYIARILGKNSIKK